MARRAACCDRACEVDKGHGRIAKRTLEVTTGLTAYLEPDWPGCPQVFRLERGRRTAGRVEVEVAYGMTSLPRERAGARELLVLTRGHWGTESGLHGVRDGTLREDASRIRKGSGLQVTAIMRSLAIFLFKRTGYKSAAAAARHYVCNPEESLGLLSTPI